MKSPTVSLRKWQFHVVQVNTAGLYWNFLDSFCMLLDSLILESWSKVLDKMLGRAEKYQTKADSKMVWRMEYREQRELEVLWAEDDGLFSRHSSSTNHSLLCFHDFVHVVPLAWHTIHLKSCLTQLKSVITSTKRSFLGPYCPALDWVWLSILSPPWHHSIVFASCICISLFPKRLWAHWKWITMPGTEQLTNK